MFTTPPRQSRVNSLLSFGGSQSPRRQSLAEALFCPPPDDEEDQEGNPGPVQTDMEATELQQLSPSSVSLLPPPRRAMPASAQLCYHMLMQASRLISRLLDDRPHCLQTCQSAVALKILRQSSTGFEFPKRPSDRTSPLRAANHRLRDKHRTVSTCPVLHLLHPNPARPRTYPHRVGVWREEKETLGEAAWEFLNSHTSDSAYLSRHPAWFQT